MQLSSFHPFLMLANVLHNSFGSSGSCIEGHSVRFRVTDFASIRSCDHGTECDLHYKARFVGGNTSVYFFNENANDRHNKTIPDPETLEYVHADIDEDTILQIQFIDVNTSNLDIHVAFLDAERDMEAFPQAYAGLVGYVWQQNQTLSSKNVTNLINGTIKPSFGPDPDLTISYEAEVNITSTDCSSSTRLETTMTAERTKSLSQTASTPLSTSTRLPRAARKRPCINLVF